MFAVHRDKMTLAVLLDGLPLGRFIFRKAVEADLMHPHRERSESQQKGEPQLCLSREATATCFARGHSSSLRPLLSVVGATRPRCKARALPRCGIAKPADHPASPGRAVAVQLISLRRRIALPHHAR